MNEATASRGDVTWTVELARPERPPEVVATLDDPLHTEQHLCESVGRGAVGPVTVTCAVEPAEAYTRVVARAEVERGEAEIYLLLRCSYGEDAALQPYTFSGPADGREIYRQSPHDPADHRVDMAKQAVPMIALRGPDGFLVAVSDNPATCDNYTTQEFDPDAGWMALCSGDSGETPGHVPQVSKVESHYHTLAPGAPHRFELILFGSDADDLLGLRGDVAEAIAARWNGPDDHLGAIAYSGNYMHYRRNETGHSRYWVCPGIDYANKQYSRDAFWQALILPMAMAQECYRAEANGRYTGAERPIFRLIWSYRIQQRGGEADLDAARDALDYIERHTRDGAYYASEKPGGEGPGRKDFQSWYDLCAFEPDDVITYNQGLLAVALLAAERLGLATKLSAERAIAQYDALYVDVEPAVDGWYRSATGRGAGPDGCAYPAGKLESGYYGLSRLKPALAVDGLAGDLLAQVLFQRALLPDARVRAHLTRLTRYARTRYGYKVACAPDGRYLPPSFYDAEGYPSRTANIPLGRYANGGSYYLYDMLCLMACRLHGIAEAEEEMIWRTRIEFELGGTWHEHLNTLNGAPGKPNQGWNAAIYALWRTLMEQGRVGERFIREVNRAIAAAS